MTSEESPLGPGTECVSAAAPWDKGESGFPKDSALARQGQHHLSSVSSCQRWLHPSHPCKQDQLLRLNGTLFTLPLVVGSSQPAGGFLRSATKMHEVTTQLPHSPFLSHLCIPVPSYNIAIRVSKCRAGSGQRSETTPLRVPLSILNLLQSANKVW